MIVRSIPPIVLMVPLFDLVIKHGFYDEPLMLIVVYSAFNLPFAVWVMVSFIQTSRRFRTSSRRPRR